MAEESSAAVGRALAYGCISLNSVFVVRQKRHRVFKRFSLRLSIAEIVWIAIVTISLGLIIYGLILASAGIPGLRDIVSYYLLILAPLGGFILGRVIARTSPYRRYSGEGLNEYLWVQRDNLSKEIGRVFGRGVSITRNYATVDGRRMAINCVEWLGTARATSMPRPKDNEYIPSKDEKKDFVYLNIKSSSQPLNWVKEHQNRENKNWGQFD